MVYDEKYLQKENENFLDWKLRLIIGKIEKTIDIDWSEIVEILGLPVHPDTLRKTAYGIYEYYRYFEARLYDKVEDNKVLNELEKKRIEIEIERKKLQTISIEYNKILREEARNQMYFEELRKSMIKVVPPNFLPLQSREKLNKVGVLSFADFHFGKIFTSINNEYNEDILLERMSRLSIEIIHIVEKEKLTHIHIINLADMVEGMALRISQLTSLQMGITDMVIRYSRMMVEWLNLLTKIVKVTYHNITNGNHSEIRPLGTSAGQFPRENMERIISLYIHDMLLNNERIEVPMYEDGHAIINILDYTIFATHGQDIKNPKKAIKDLSYLYRTMFDYLLVGHYHHGEEVTVAEGIHNNCEVIKVPSIMGSDSYSDGLMTGAKAGAKFMIFEENKGKSITYDIILN